MATETTETPTEPVEATEPAETSEPVEATEAEAEAAKPEEEGGDEAAEPEAEQDVNEWSDDEFPPSGDVVPEAPVVAEEEDEEKAVKSVEFADTGDEIEADAEPDFSKYRTNVAERLWRVRKADTETKGATGPDIFANEKEFQEFRKQMALLNRCVEDYATAMQAVAAKRDQVMRQYAHLSKGTPLWDRIGEPLTEEQLSEVRDAGDLVSMEGVEARTLAIMKVADDIGAGSLMAHQQLAMMQDELSAIDFKKHTSSHIEEWDEVVTSQVDAEVKQLRATSKRRDHYIEKVDKLRERVNKIEHKGKGIASKRLSDRLDRNEKKLADIDVEYQELANGLSVLLYEATKRGWVDLYPVLKNVMKFEINRLGRESACYGSFHATLASLKNDYKVATQGTPDEPAPGSAL